MMSGNIYFYYNRYIKVKVYTQLGVLTWAYNRRLRSAMTKAKVHQFITRL